MLENESLGLLDNPFEPQPFIDDTSSTEFSTKRAPFYETSDMILDRIQEVASFVLKDGHQLTKFQTQQLGNAYASPSNNIVLHVVTNSNQEDIQVFIFIWYSLIST
jgi:hypothetical protein